MLFSERMKIDKEFQEWCNDLTTKEYKVKYCIASFISFMQSKAKDNYKTASHFSIVSCPDSSGTVCKKCGNQMKLTANGGYPCGTICYSCPNCDDIDAK